MTLFVRCNDLSLSTGWKKYEQKHPEALINGVLSRAIGSGVKTSLRLDSYASGTVNTLPLYRCNFSPHIICTILLSSLYLGTGPTTPGHPHPLQPVECDTHKCPYQYVKRVALINQVFILLPPFVLYISIHHPMILQTQQSPVPSFLLLPSLHHYYYHYQTISVPTTVRRPSQTYPPSLSQPDSTRPLSNHP